MCVGQAARALGPWSTVHEFEILLSKVEDAWSSLVQSHSSCTLGKREGKKQHRAVMSSSLIDGFPVAVRPEDDCVDLMDWYSLLLLLRSALVG